MPITKSVVDLLWDRVFELAEDEDTRGKINYTNRNPTGSVTVTLGGVRYTVTIETED